jgi:hypothetical protein
MMPDKFEQGKKGRKSRLLLCRLHIIDAKRDKKGERGRERKAINHYR